MITPDMLNRNLLALSSRETALSSRLSRVSPAGDLVFKTARNGDPVPVVLRNRREFPLHSLFDPQKEAQKFAGEYPGGGYVIFLGFGCGYHIEPFLSQDNVNGILIIDRDLSQLKSLISARDFRRIFLDSRVRFLMDPRAGQVRDFLLSNCFPAVTGNIQVLPLRSRMDLERGYFAEIFRTVKETLNEISGDFTVQTSFGKKWFTNTLANLPAAEKSTAVPRHTQKALITAAGPSLETALRNFPAGKEAGLVIATDTSYPALRKWGIKPDLVVSIDCQHISYHHFLAGYQEDIPLVLDLASPAALARLSRNPVFFTSGHPFSIYINRRWRQFPLVDTSGGNVTHAAVSLAARLGARKVVLAGADFCYPRGKSYARGTYIYPHFHSRSFRRSPGEGSFYDFVFRNPNLTRRPWGGEILYAARSLEEYGQRLWDAFGGYPGFMENLSPYRNGGELSAVPAPSEMSSPEMSSPEMSSPERFPSEGIFFGAGPAKTGWRSFLESYRNELLALPSPALPAARYFEHLPPEKRALWMTILPAAAAMRKAPEIARRDSSEILIAAFDWTLETLDKAVGGLS